MDIDFVLPWVDGNDPEWQQEFLQYFPESQYRSERFRDWGTLRYWFRAIEKFAPWVHRIYFVTNGQKPDWLRTDHPKIRWVKHQDYIPQDYLPTFCSNVIELNYHRVPGLSEHFVLFNDDMFLNASIEPEYYFRKGLPVDAPLETFAAPLTMNDLDWWKYDLNLDLCVGLLNRHFSRNATIRQCPYRWFGHYLGWRNILIALLISYCDSFKRFRVSNETHRPLPFLKSVFEEVWGKEEVWLHRSCMQKLRAEIQLTDYLMRYWQLASNKFYPKRCRNNLYITLSHNTRDGTIRKILNSPNLKTICFNDSETCSQENYLRLKAEMQQAFEQKFPNKSSFEL